MRDPCPDEEILQPGRNCWRVARASRARLLVDGEAYFGAVAAALERARRRVILIGWDFATRMRLRRDEDSPGLLAFLDALARRRPGLQVHVLAWDFAMLYALERELLPRLRFGPRSHPRVHFELDDHHPIGGSHHQKLVVVDDRVAFLGGLDMTSSRWDTPEHRAHDPRRSDPGFPDYEPFHDVGLVLEGPVAEDLAEVARSRWEAGTGQRLVPVARHGPTCWPEGLVPHFEDVSVGIARTRPDWEDLRGCREVEALHLDALRAARRHVYIENQYLTAGAVADVLEERLREADGPEVVIVGPETCAGWLEQATMGVLRARIVERLRAADAHGHFGIFHPVVPGLGDRTIHVHAKLAVVDDRLLRVGSANLSNRSMGLDTELDVAIEARSPQVADTITRLRNGLLAEHLGVPVERVEEGIRTSGSLLCTVEKLGGGERGLRRLEPDVSVWARDWVPDSQVLDPERPVGFEELSARLLNGRSEGEETAGRSLLARVAPVLLSMAALAAAWHLTPLAEWASPERLAALAAPLRAAPLGPVAAALAIALGASLFLPITALIVASALIYGPWLGAGVAWGGSVLGALFGYAVGRGLWGRAVSRLMTPRLRRLSRWLARRGLLAIATIRIVPVAPFAAVNMAAGASSIRLRDYALGTSVAMVPGIVGLALVANRAARAVIEPGWRTFLVLAVLVGLLAAAARWARHRLSSHADG